MEIETRTWRISLAVSIGLIALPWSGCRQPDGRYSLPKPFAPLFRHGGQEKAATAVEAGNPGRRPQGVVLPAGGGQDRSPKLCAQLLASDEDPAVRRAAVRTLGRSGESKYLPNMVEALSDPSPAVRWDAAAALDQVLADAAAKSLQKQAATNKSVNVRINCTRALRRYRRPDVAATLIRCLADESFAVRFQARASLREITGQDFGYDAEQWAKLQMAAPPQPAAGQPARRRPELLGLRQRPARVNSAAAAAETAAAMPAPAKPRPQPTSAPAEKPKAQSPARTALAERLPPTGLPLVKPRTPPFKPPVNPEEYQ